jgi:hypothetical protein
LGNGDGSNAGFSPIRSGPAGNQKMMLIAHGVLAGLAFVILFPAGAIAIRLASFPGVIWLHAVFQVFAYLVYIAAFGIGVYMANQMNLVSLLCSKSNMLLISRSLNTTMPSSV